MRSWSDGQGKPGPRPRPVDLGRGFRRSAQADCAAQRAGQRQGPQAAGGPRPRADDRAPSLGEPVERHGELVPRLRGVSHAGASVLAIAAAVIVIVIAPAGRATVAAAIYGAGLIALFSCSALYHRWPGPV